VTKPSIRAYLEVVDQSDLVIGLTVPPFTEYQWPQYPIRRVGVAAPPHRLSAEVEPQFV
jgi:hypothetical protein